MGVCVCVCAFRLRWLRSLWSFWRWVWWAVGARRLWGPRQVRDGVWWQGAGATHGLHEGTAVLCQRARRSQGKLTSLWVCNSAFITHTHSIQMDHSHRFTCFRLTYLLWSYSMKHTNVRYVVRMIFLLHSQQHQNNFISVWNEIGGIFLLLEMSTASQYIKVLRPTQHTVVLDYWLNGRNSIQSKKVFHKSQ